MSAAQITRKGRRLYFGSEMVGEITGWRKMTAKWGVTGPGYGFMLVNGNECEPTYAYFDDAVKEARAAIAKAMGVSK